MFSFSAFKFVFKGFAFGIPAGITLIDIVGYVAKVEGSSMQPILNPDSSPSTISDYVFLHNWPIVNNNYEEIERGEIIALISPRDPKQRLIKRVIGVPVRTLNRLINCYFYYIKYLKCRSREPF